MPAVRTLETVQKAFLKILTIFKIWQDLWETFETSFSEREMLKTIWINIIYIKFKG